MNLAPLPRVRPRAARARRAAARATKRLFDVTVAAAGLVVLSPVTAGVAAAIRARMGSPVLFRQTRPGMLGRPFVLLKFRTMLPPGTADREAEEDFDARLTGLGRWLRVTSLDEVPQLVNVLRGDLSLVGPRPLLAEYLPLYDREQARRHDVRPGITGLAQIHGRSTSRMEDRFRHDVWYVDHWSLLLDLRILARTVACVLLRRGVAGDGAPSEPAWAGNAPAVPVPRRPADDGPVLGPAAPALERTGR